MTDQYAMTPKQALAMIEGTGVEDPAKLIRDHAAAGLIRSYAQLQVTIAPDGGRHEVRGGKVQPATWERVVAAGADADVWSGGTVRLVGSDLIGGTPAIHVTGVTFHLSDIERLANQQRPSVEGGKPQQNVSVAPNESGEDQGPTQKSARQKRPQPDPTAIQPGAILCTIKQAGEALGIGRTKVNELMTSGRLIRKRIDGGVRIEVASVRSLAEISD
ncbi:helix-turn-helix domain-containing protein [uncultured Sphingomonas sp.]|uniref:helix-turn-helix domain-containing protein n=1 Tax=uncultured Sphingomonas sp. TaxID=158754 RepID=UPI002589C735|nr:helix-turn-helix domain-containing protein [uncultured Sphingomonas sp.]